MPLIDMGKTGQNIENLRKKAGLSVKDLQDVFGFGADTIRQRKRIDISRKVEIFINLANFFTLLFHFCQEVV